MAYTPVKLVSGVLLNSSTTVMYTAPNGTTIRISTVVLKNTDNSNPHTVSVWIAPSAVAPNNSSYLIQKTLAAGETYVLYQAQNLVLTPGNTIQAVCDNATVVTMFASGTSITG